MDQELRAIANRRHGVVLAADLAGLGLDRNARRRVAANMYRLRRGAYAIDPPRSPEHWHMMRVVAAIATRAPGPMASHVSAAVLHGLPVSDSDLSLVHLTWPKEPHSARSGVIVHQAETGADEVDTIPVTPVARTVLDCARSLSREQGVVMADFALQHGLTTTTELTEALSGLKVRGVSRARCAVALADGRAESVGESRTRLICHDAGIAVTPQVWIRDAQGRRLARVDLWVDGTPVVIEFDGAEKYRDPEGDARDKHWQEKVRRETIEDQGYVVVNVYWKMLDTPGLVVAKIRRAITRVSL